MHEHTFLQRSLVSNLLLLGACTAGPAPAPATAPTSTSAPPAEHAVEVPLEKLAVASTAPVVGRETQNTLQGLKALALPTSSPSVKQQIQVDSAKAGKPDFDTIEAVSAAFNFQGTSCIPAALKKKIAKDKNWAPPGLRELVNGIPAQKVTRLGEQTASVILHTVRFDANGDGVNEAQYVATSSPTFANLDPLRYSETETSRFVYTLDCSGMFSAAATLGLKVPAAELQSAAKASQEASSTSIVARARVYPPALVALFPSGGNEGAAKAMSRSERLGVLFAILQALPPEASDNARIIPDRIVDLLWTATKRNSSFQGQADLSASASGGFGVATASGNVSARVNLQRSISFDSYQTYLIEAAPLDSKTYVKTLSGLREDIARAVAEAELTKPLTKVNESYTFTIDFPYFVCREPEWTIKGKTETKVKGEFSGGACTFKWTPSGATAGVKAFQLIGKGHKLRVKYELALATQP